jgi:hypothetical protein
MTVHYVSGAITNTGAQNASAIRGFCYKLYSVSAGDPTTATIHILPETGNYPKRLVSMVIMDFSFIQKHRYKFRAYATN